MTGEAPAGLKAGALKTRDVVIVALASSGPTQSVAVSLAAILATVAYAGFVVVASIADGDLDAVELWAGVGLVLFGFVLSFVSRLAGRSPFYTDPASAEIPDA